MWWMGTMEYCYIMVCCPKRPKAHAASRWQTIIALMMIYGFIILFFCIDVCLMYVLLYFGNVCFVFSLHACSMPMERDPCGTPPGRLQRRVSMETRQRQRAVPQPKIYPVRAWGCSQVLQQKWCEWLLYYLNSHIKNVTLTIKVHFAIH